MRPEQERGQAPEFTVGQQVEATIDSIERTQGQYGEQYQFDVSLKPSGWRARAWIKYYPVPAPNQYLGKLCLAIERVTGQSFSSVDTAIAALKSYGKIYLRVSGFNNKQQDDGSVKSYPKFAVAPDNLPGEQAQQPITQPKMEPVTDLNAPKSTKNDLSTAAYKWLAGNIMLIGEKIPDTAWNKLVELKLVGDFAKYSLIEMKYDEPYLSERARDYL